MRETIDIDKLFEAFVRSELASGKLRPTEDDWSDMIPELYARFEKTPLKELGGVTPVEYFDDEPQIKELWLRYIENGVPLNDYVINAVADKVPVGEIAALLNEDADEEVLLSAIEIMRRKDVKSVVNGYIDLLFSKKVCHHVKDEIVEDLCYCADDVADKILSRVDEKSADGAVAEILSNVKKKDGRIKRILLDGLKTKNKVPEYSAYLVNYDDESCLAEMLAFLPMVDDYVSYKELKMAIEALGGSVDEKRDFSQDKNYIRIKAAENDIGKEDK